LNAIQEYRSKAALLEVVLKMTLLIEQIWANHSRHPAATANVGIPPM